MSYTKNVWREHSHSTAQKLTALDSLEGMYDEAVTYINAITHSSRYYTDAQAAAKFFSSSTDGSGSGLVATTLDGYSADQIIAAGIPSGNIAWWSGSEASIPDGWYLCNGLNGTPDLRDRFIVGAGSHYAKAARGGAITVTTTATITIAGHILTAAEIPKHGHGITGDYNNNLNYMQENAARDQTPGTAIAGSTSRTTGNTGGGSSHTHPATWTGTTGQSKTPPYYALCIIMKS